MSENPLLQQSASTTMQDVSFEINSEMDGKYLTFWTDKQLFGVSIADVVQIVGLQDITPIPDYPHYAKGIINLRGSIIPIIDVRLRIGRLENAYTERTCIIVTSIRERLMGFLVDAVEAVTDIDDTLVSPPPQMSTGSETAYLTGIATLDIGVVLLIDTKKLLGENEFTSLVQAAE